MDLDMLMYPEDPFKCIELEVQPLLATRKDPGRARLDEKFEILEMPESMLHELDLKSPPSG
jgi:hypothetical protein